MQLNVLTTWPQCQIASSPLLKSALVSKRLGLHVHAHHPVHVYLISLQGDSGSSNGDEVEDHKLERRGLDRCARGYLENDRILVWYGKGKTLRTYEAKILGVEETESRRDYLVHYNGWNTR